MTSSAMYGMEDNSTSTKKKRQSIEDFKFAYKWAQDPSAGGGMGIFAPNSGKYFESDTEAMQTYLAACHNGYCNYVRGKRMKQQFNIQVDNPCQFFNWEMVKNLSKEHQAEYKAEIERCHQKNISREAAFKDVIKPTWLLNECTVDYAITWKPINYIWHRARPCQQALVHMTMPRDYEVDIENMQVCMNNSVFPFIKKCGKRHNLLNLATAKEVLIRSLKNPNSKI